MKTEIVRRLVGVVACVGMPLGLGACLVQRTVTDSSGEVIYQEPEVHLPFESEQKKQEEVMKKERELGW